MKSFSERYGYISPSNELIIGELPREVINAIINCLHGALDDDIYNLPKKAVWLFFLNNKITDFIVYNDCIERYLESTSIKWHLKLDLVEFIIQAKGIIPEEQLDIFVYNLNSDFERLHYGYRIVDDFVVQITSNTEIECIEETIDTAEDNIKEHFQKAIEHLSNREKPDFRNSIKESISAVGVICRKMTGENDLGKALYVLQKKRGMLHPQLKDAFAKLYDYSNDKNSGIRHELMDESGTYIPSYYEAKFMLVVCSAFVNYMNGIDIADEI